METRVHGIHVSTMVVFGIMSNIFRTTQSQEGFIHLFKVFRGTNTQLSKVSTSSEHRAAINARTINVRIARWSAFFNGFVRVSDCVQLPARDFRRIYKRAFGGSGSSVQTLNVRRLQSAINQYNKFIRRFHG